MQSPLHQFLIKEIVPIHIGGINLSFTNSALFMVLSTATILLFFNLGIQKRQMIPNRFQSMVELSYDFISSLVEDNVGSEGKKYFPLVLSIFLFVLFGNLFGMLPYAFTYTSHIIVTFSLAAFIFVVVTFIGLSKFRWAFFKRFMPEGAPLAIAPLLIPVELLSYLFRPISLSVRLFANMLAGHVILKMFAAFTVMLGLKYGGIAPLLFDVVFVAFEFFIALLQAYIFTILTCIYLHDALHLH